MDKRYEAFCQADPLFYDSPNNAPATTVDGFAAGRELPAGWHRDEIADWLLYAPIGGSLPQQGWKIHVSACRENAERILDKVWLYCVPRNMPFKFLRDERALLLRNAKYARRGSSGKFVTIYPADDAALAAACRELGGLLAGEPGPYILSDLRWAAGPVHVRYGGFAARYCLDGADVVPAIENADGTLVPDRRDPVFTVPDWVTLPDFLAPHLAARNAVSTTELPYRIERVIHFSNGGGLYVAQDTRTGTKVVLKEARPHAGLDADGVDAVTRLQRERAMLDQLADLPEVPDVHDYFELGEHHFLALEFIEGQALNKVLVERYPLADADADAAERAAYRDWALDLHAQVDRVIAAIHAHGVVYGDLHLFNVLVRPDGRIALVDFEVATTAAEQGRPALRNQGFAAPRGTRGLDVDRYALGCLKLALFLPLTTMLRLAPEKAAHLAEIAADRYDMPPETLADAVRTITGTTDPADSHVDSPRFEPDLSGWQRARSALAGAILASATPERDDRLFPGDVEQFRSGGLNLAHGAAGVLYALAVTGAGQHREHEEWLVTKALAAGPGSRVGFYDGLHGVAYTLDRLGWRDEALELLDRSLREQWQELGSDLFGGLAGIGLNLLHFTALTGNGDYAAAAVEAGDRIAHRLGDVDSVPELSGGRHPQAGLAKGASGAALFFLRLHERTADTGYLDLAATALRQDLRRCMIRPDGAMEVNEGWRTMPYLAEGSVGIGLVLDQYLRHRPDEQFTEAAAAIARAARSPFYAQSGLFAGRAGIVHYLAQVGQQSSELDEQIRALAWHAMPYRGQLAFPGDQLLRLSMDLATGTAGVLLALGAALHQAPVGLPFLETSPHRGENRPYETQRGGVNNDASRPSGHGASGGGGPRRRREPSESAAVRRQLAECDHV